jgi:hypothetical protein
MAAELSCFYNIPCCGTAGVSDENEPSVEVLIQKTLSWFFEGIAGAQYINSAVGMLEQVMTVCIEQYIIDDKALGIVRQAIADWDGTGLAEYIHGVVKKVLEACGVGHELLMQEIDKRIEFILDRKESYSPENIQRQVEQIKTAISSDNSNVEFLIHSQEGLEAGWLYRGGPVTENLDITEITEIKTKLLHQ